VVVADDPEDFAEALRAALASPEARSAAAQEAQIWTEQRRQRFADEVANEIGLLVAPRGAEALPA
jgi:hypothetical protein